MRLEAIIRPGVSVTVAADVFAGYVLAASAMPEATHAMPAAPLLFASALLLVSAGRMLSACFGEALPRDDLKRFFIAGISSAAFGLLAVMSAAVYAGHLVIYPAALILLQTWASEPKTAGPVVGPLGAGAARTLCLALGMAAHPDALLEAGDPAIVALGLYFAYGALVETLEQSQAEGGRRYMVTFAFAGLVAILVAAAFHVAADSPLRIAAFAGAGFVTVRAIPAIRTLVPVAIGRLTEAAYVSALFMTAAIVWGRWKPEGLLLLLGAATLALVPAAVALFGREERLERI